MEYINGEWVEVDADATVDVENAAGGSSDSSEEVKEVIEEVVKEEEQFFIEPQPQVDPFNWEIIDYTNVWSEA